jgi:hypothetical protein
MLTRRDVLNHLKRVGVKEFSQLKRDCREFEQYMAVYYDYIIVKKHRPNPLSNNKLPIRSGEK